ncbi:hypothetical protein MNEG_15099 [Monoraphidium neglectum]|uniref:3'-5' exonuclease n=1 Tax=Monoraphidium neglectum TaxID=145388 RepID=A0A0D2LM28_9CHLO|nr:hypothetical protein MNEG_15099 [Monoraphidium neglectum]KIY92864.1 hypothetical protein MNEG_15099 [Monoraphidium neglectum]|eukprot:XP_013891884.1 hypothetical protein MNEG_15099 [Monoraphidium neglectum]
MTTILSYSQELLVREDVLLLGVNIGGDALKMRHDWGVTPASCSDISDTANGRVLGHLPGIATSVLDTRRWSLASLAAEVLRVKVPKPSHIRMGNWEARPLSRDQRAYAALDAFLGLQLHWALSALPKRVGPEQLHMAALRARAAAARATGAGSSGAAACGAGASPAAALAALPSAADAAAAGLRA